MRSAQISLMIYKGKMGTESFSKSRKEWLEFEPIVLRLEGVIDTIVVQYTGDGRFKVTGPGSTHYLDTIPRESYTGGNDLNLETVSAHWKNCSLSAMK